MTTKEFCIEHGACDGGISWAESVGLLDKPMIELWKRIDLKHDWRLWILTRPGVASDRDLRLFACNCVRQIWDFVGPEGKHAVEVSERFVNGLATTKELTIARAVAGAAAWAIWDAAWVTRAIARGVAGATAGAAAWASGVALAAAAEATGAALDKQIELMMAIEVNL